MDLIAALPYDFLVTDHVAEEIGNGFEDQIERFNQAVAAGTLTQVALTSEDELEAFAQLTDSGRFGVGECSAIACVVCRGHALAIDDRRATTQAHQASNDLEVVRTEDLVVAMISEGLLTVDEADQMKDDWSQNHRFTLTFGSFQELLGDQ
jgi:hypothetical protein